MVDKVVKMLYYMSINASLKVEYFVEDFPQFCGKELYHGGSYNCNFFMCLNDGDFN